MKNVLFYLVLIISIVACSSPAVDGKEEDDHKTPERSVQATDTLLKYYNDQIIKSPSSPDVFLDRGRYYWSIGNVSNALNDLDAALSIDSTRADVYLERGELYFDNKNFEAALADYQTCVAYDAQNTTCLLRLATMNIHLQNYEKAISQLNDGLKVNEHLPEAYYLKGRIYKEIGDTALSASSYQTAIEVDPNYYEAYIEVALLYATAQSDLAIEYNRTAIEIKPNSVEALYNLAIYLQETGFRDSSRYDEALELYDTILEIDPNNASAPFNKGYVYLEYFQDYNAAIEEFTKAVESFPSYAQAYYNRGLCYESLDNKEEALKNYNTALTIEPAFTAAALAKGRVLGN